VISALGDAMLSAPVCRWSSSICSTSAIEMQDKSPERITRASTPKSSVRSKPARLPTRSGVSARLIDARNLSSDPDSALAMPGPIIFPTAAANFCAICDRRRPGSSLNSRSTARISGFDGRWAGSDDGGGGSDLTAPALCRASAFSMTATSASGSNGFVMASIAPVCCTN
jgi:hypothetical protein